MEPIDLTAFTTRISSGPNFSRISSPPKTGRPLGPCATGASAGSALPTIRRPHARMASTSTRACPPPPSTRTGGWRHARTSSRRSAGRGSELATGQIMESLVQNGLEIDLAQLGEHARCGILRSPIRRMHAQHRRLHGRIACPTNGGCNRIAPLVAIDDARGPRAPLLPDADIHRWYVGGGRLDDAARRIADHHVRLLEGPEIEFLPERGHEHGAPDVLLDEPLEPLVDRTAARIRVGAGEKQRGLGKLRERSQELLDAAHGIGIAQRGRMISD